MNRHDRVLVVGASAGGGHMVAAQALAHALRSLNPSLEVESLDVLDLTSRFFRRLYAGGYLTLARHAPAAFGWLYETMDRPPTFLRDTVRAWFQDHCAQRFVRDLLRRPPRLVVNTHYLSAEIVARLRRAARLPGPQVIVTTDYDTHRMWVHEPCERYYTATPDARAHLAAWGVPPERILVTGIPVRPGFVEPPSKHAARARCGLDADRPVVLVLSGGFGVGPTAQIVAQLVDLPSDAHVVVITGRNAALQAQLEAQTHFARARVRIIGFTEAVHDWMSAADLVVTKPGGLTVAESLACGLPLVIVQPIPGQEARNSDYLLERGAAIAVGNPRLLRYRVGTLLADREPLDRMRAAARALARPHAAHDIAADALRLIAAASSPV